MTVELPQQLNSLSHHDDLEDIESLTLPSDDPTSSVNRPSFRQVTIKRFNRRKKTEKAEYKAPDSQLNSHSDNNVSDGEDVEESMDDGESFNVPVGYLPGKASVWVKTWGCSHNNSDSEYMAGLLNSHGYNIVSESHKDSAQLWLLNSCTVKNPSEQTFVNAINAAKDSGKHVVLAGCVTQAQPKNKIWEGLSIVGVQQIDRVVEVVEETLKGHTVKILETKKDMDSKKKAGGARLNLPKIRKNPLIEIIPINTGCLNQCTYCKTKHARGDLGSYPPEEILARVRQVLAEGVVEIWLTSEDTGTYGRDIGASLPDLLWKIVEIMPEGTMLRVGMTNPPYILEHLEEISKILAHPRVYAFLHVPVQAASNKVLDDMRRQYTLAEFKHVVDFLRDRVPGMTIATDVICGFPTESEEDFEETLQLVQEYKFPVLHISQFYPRPGTPAARLQKLPTADVKRRSRALTSLFESYRTYDHQVSQIQTILITELSTDQLHYVGHNKYYNQVLVKREHPEDNRLMGKTVKVKLTEAAKYHMIGELLEAGEESNGAKSLPPLNGTSESKLPSSTSSLENPVASVSSPRRHTIPVLLIFVAAMYIAINEDKLTLKLFSCLVALSSLYLSIVTNIGPPSEKAKML